MIRAGHRFDVQALGPPDHPMLCGVRVPFHPGFVAHSDGDKAVHALADAVLGAAALGDISQHVPDTDPQWRGADSRMLLRSVVDRVADVAWHATTPTSPWLPRRPRARRTPRRWR